MKEKKTQTVKTELLNKIKKSNKVLSNSNNYATIACRMVIG